MSNFKTVFKKELIDIFRDKKTIIFTILLPILLYPIMFKIMSTSMTHTVEDIQKGVNIVLKGDIESTIAKVLINQELIKIVEIDDEKSALKNGAVQAVVNIPDNIDEDIEKGNTSKIEILVDDKSNKSTGASSIITDLYENYSKQIVEERLINKGMDASIITPYELEVKSGVSDDSKVNTLGAYLMGMLPSLIIMLLLAPTVGLAAEMGAGEKEKTTFEPLLSTSANRSAILWGKISSLSVVGFIVMIGSIISLYSSFNMYADALGAQGEMKMEISTAAMVIMMLISTVLIITMSTIQIAVSIVARSTKEANTYLTGTQLPLMLLCFLPMFSDANNMNPMFFHIPITNAAAIMKEILMGVYNIQHIIVVIGWLLVYVVLAMLVAKIMFSREEVVFRS